MERIVLKQFLNAPPSRRFDVAFFSRKIVTQNGGQPLLFHSRFLNEAILFKLVDGGTSGMRRGADRRVETLIFLPYDSERPGDGGEGFVFGKETFLRICADRLSPGDGVATGVAGDLKKLSVLQTLPTFSPFLVDLAFQRSKLESCDAYTPLSPALRRTLADHLQGRLRPLIVAAFKGVHANIERAVEDLVQKLFCLRDLDDVMPMVEALRLPPERAQSVLNAWLGIAYFEYEYSILQPRLAEVAASLARLDSSVSERFSRSECESIAAMIAAIKRMIRADWNAVLGISREYRASYDGLVFGGQIGPFIAFLNAAERHYWKLGEVLGRLEQVVLVWQDCGGSGLDGFRSFTRGCDVRRVLRHLQLVIDDGRQQPAGPPAASARTARVS